MVEKLGAERVLDEMIAVAEQKLAPIIYGRAVYERAMGRVFSVASEQFPRTFDGEVLGDQHQQFVAEILKAAEAEAERDGGRIWRNDMGPDIWFWPYKTNPKPKTMP